MGVLSKIGAGLVKKTSKDSSKEVAKRGTEVISRKPEKFMGMAEEVGSTSKSRAVSAGARDTGGTEYTGRRSMTDANKKALKSIGDKMKEGAKKPSDEGVTRGGAGKAVAAGVAATAAGVAALSGGKSDKEDKGSSGKGRSYQDERPTRDAGRTSGAEESKAKESDKKPSSFGAAFKEARAAGKDVFTFNGKKYTTEMAGEKKAAPKGEEKKETGVREGRNENIDDDTRKRAMASVANLAKGGLVTNKGIGASMKAHNLFGKKR